MLSLTGLAEVELEYILGFAFGWTIFQALFMRDLAGGSYRRALAGTFVSELLSMNFDGGNGADRDGAEGASRPPPTPPRQASGS